MRIQPGTTNDLNPVVQGAQYRATHKASVLAILGDEAPRVMSKGCKFYNADRWTGRMLVKTMCEWASKNPGCVPTHGIVQQWVAEVNQFQFPARNREIVIASTPDTMPLRTAMALVGGAYHEALHTKYSCRRNLTTHEIASIIVARWAKVDDWSKHTKALMDWSNIIEDIKIERRGCEFYDGIHGRMCDLHDFVLNLEHDLRLEDLKAKGKGPSAMGIVQCVFRDVGKGYETDLQKITMDRYTQWNQQAVMMVVQGPLTPMVDEAIGLAVDDELGSLRVAMDVIEVLANLIQNDKDDGESNDSNDGNDGEQTCPRCGADASKLKVRPKSNGGGGKVHGKGIITCTECGWQQEINVDVKPPKNPKEKKPDEPKKPEMDFDGFDADEYDLDPTDDDKKDKGDPKDSKENGDKPKSDTPKGGKGHGKDKDDDEEGDASEGEGSNPGEGEDKNGKGSKSGEGDGDDDGQGGKSEQGEGQGGESEQGEGEECKSADGASDGPGSGMGPIDKDTPHDATKAQDEFGDSGKDGIGAGGHKDTSNNEVDNDWSGLAKDINDSANQDTGVKDVGEALEAGVNAAIEKEDAKLDHDEAPWRPFDTSRDKAELVKPSRKGKESDTADADKILASVKTEVAYLRSRLRTLIRSMEMKGVTRGVAKGRVLSSRYLVETRGAVRDGHKPNRAFDRQGETVDMTMACAVVLDESGSMGHLRVDATRIMMALAEPLDALNAPTLVIGFRDIFEGWGVNNPVADGGTYHRYSPIGYDIFKTFDERFRQVRWRFANTQADGGTPMADGVQFALNALSHRTEAHRFMFVVTDGCPNYGHLQVMNHQIRLAKEAGIYVIGVGIGGGAAYVKNVFPDHVWSNNMSEFPRLLAAKLNEFVDVQATKRGHIVKDTSK